MIEIFKEIIINSYSTISLANHNTVYSVYCYN